MSSATLSLRLPDHLADQFPALAGKFTGLRKYRIGDYRVIYTILDDTVLILRIAREKMPSDFSKGGTRL